MWSRGRRILRLAERLEGEGDIVVDLGCPLFEVLFADAVLLVAGDGGVRYDQSCLAPPSMG